MSAIDVAITRDMHAAAAAKGLQYLDFPVSGCDRVVGTTR
jgi:3-hydroxyisobutyrate dehydrogenase-like beta-hydroxyacid dehydrogenase